MSRGAGGLGVGELGIEGLGGVGGSGGVPFVRVSGEPVEVGYWHGRARAEALREFLGDGLARINRLAAVPVTVESLRPELAEYEARIAAAAPALSEEIDGLADGAGISRELAVLLQVRREIIGYQRIPARGDCTTYASLTAGPGGGPVLAQTVDLNGDLDDQIAVLDVGVSGSGASGRRALVLSFGGLLGYLGINSDGLAIGLNLVLGGEWRPGLPPYLAIRYLLDNAGSVSEAVEMLRGLCDSGGESGALASSRSLMLCDPGNVACVEILDNELRFVEAVHTNHFLHPDFAGRDELNVFARNSSLLRMKAAQSGLAALGSGDVAKHFGLLCQPAICVAGTGDIRRERTVAAVVMLPGRRELHLRPGDPSVSSTQSFALAAS